MWFWWLSANALLLFMHHKKNGTVVKRHTLSNSKTSTVWNKCWFANGCSMHAMERYKENQVNKHDCTFCHCITHTCLNHTLNCMPLQTNSAVCRCFLKSTQAELTLRSSRNPFMSLYSNKTKLQVSRSVGYRYTCHSWKALSKKWIPVGCQCRHTH